MTRTVLTAPVLREKNLPKSAFGAVVDWLLEADRRYREVCKLREMPEYRLKDMGIPREVADRAFLQDRK